jgi:undecaprenyl-diphosphatase
MIVAVGIGFGMVMGVAKVWDSIAERGVVVRIDQNWFSFLTAHRTARVTTLLRWVTVLGDIRLVSAIVVVSAVVLVSRREPRYAALIAASTWGAALLATIAKVVFARPRPPLSRHVVAATGAAFPSGHSAQAAACYGAVAWVLSRELRSRAWRVTIWSAAILCTTVVGFSRVYLGVHWPSDVGGGWAVGVGWLAACVAISLGIKGRLQGPWILRNRRSARAP